MTSLSIEGCNIVEFPAEALRHMPRLIYLYASPCAWCSYCQAAAYPADVIGTTGTWQTTAYHRFRRTFSSTTRWSRYCTAPAGTHCAATRANPCFICLCDRNLEGNPMTTSEALPALIQAARQLKELRIGDTLLESLQGLQSATLTTL